MEMSVTDTTTVHVALGQRSYDIQIGDAVFSRVAEYLAHQLRATHAIIITDRHVGPVYGDRLTSELADHVSRVTLLEIAPGEPSKSIAEADRLWQLLLDDGADRHTCIVAMGGA